MSLNLHRLRTTGKYIRSHYLLWLLFIVITLSARAQQSTDLVFDNLSGERVNCAELRTRGPVLVTFWALWCAPCKLELKSLQTMYEEYGPRGFTVVAINQDSPKSLAKVRAYIAAAGFTFPVGLDPNGQFIQRFNGQTIPYSVLLDSSGAIVYTSVGYVPGDEKKIAAKVKEYLSPK